MISGQLNLFDGETYEEERDQERLSGQLKRVFELMQDGLWRTLGEISFIVKGSETAISARLRDLRKDRFGNFIVDRRYRDRGLWEYKLSIPASLNM